MADVTLVMGLPYDVREDLYPARAQQTSATGVIRPLIGHFRFVCDSGPNCFMPLQPGDKLGPNPRDMVSLDSCLEGLCRTIPLAAKRSPLQEFWLEEVFQPKVKPLPPVAILFMAYGSCCRSRMFSETARSFTPWGTAVRGTITYTPAGRVSVQLLGDPNPRFSAGNVFSPSDRDLLRPASDDEIRKAYVGYYAYFGTYEIDESKRVVTHHVASSLRPHEIGSSYERPYELTEVRLVLRYLVPSDRGGTNTRVIVWRRSESLRH